MTSVEKAAALLTGQKKTIAVAESCTGGSLSKSLTETAGSSKFFILGMVTYSNESKTKMLKVPEEIIKKHGAVSEQTAIAMAEGVRKTAKTDLSIAITGIAGPDGGTKTKPVGLVFIALSSKNEMLCVKCEFKGDRQAIRDQAVDQSLQLLLEFIER
jgi:PncC family amidohydrolase